MIDHLSFQQNLTAQDDATNHENHRGKEPKAYADTPKPKIEVVDFHSSICRVSNSVFIAIQKPKQEAMKENRVMAWSGFMEIHICNQ